MNLDEVDIAWLAGLLEGEGSFMMGRNTVNEKLYLYPRIVITMTDCDVISKAAKMFATSVYTLPPSKDGRKQQYRAQINGYRAVVLMSRLLKYMGDRRSKKIQELIHAYGELEPTNIRRAKSCSATQKKRWGKYGTREGRL